MFLAGLLGFFHTSFIPGFLLLRIFRIRKNHIQTLIYSLGLSLVFNYALVLLLTLAGLYTQWMMGIIFFAEWVVLLIYYFEDLKTPISEHLQAGTIRIQRFIQEMVGIFRGEYPVNSASSNLYWWFSAVAFVLAMISFSWMFGIWQRDWFSVFKAWDAVVSWNRWAVDWAGGSFPVDPRHYPQLIPVNLSIPYVIMGTSTIQFFSKAMMGLFTLFMLLMFFDLGVTQKQPGYFVAVIMLRYMVKKFFGVHLTSGYVDLSVAFFAFLSVYILISASTRKDYKEKLPFVFLGVIFAAGAALTKQAGVYLLILYPVLVYFLVLRDIKQSLTRRDWSIYIGLPVLLAVALVIPWYVYIEFAIAAGETRSEVAWITQGIFKGQGLFERFIAAALLLEKYLVLYLIALLSVLFLKSKQRWVFGLVTLPFTLIWMFYFSYSVRNLAMVLPFICLAAGLGLETWVRKGIDFLHRLNWQQLKSAWLLVPIVLGGLGLNFLNSAEKLASRQNVLQRQILEVKLNSDLYDYFESLGSFEPIMTDYPIRYLPDMIQIGDSFDELASYHVHLAQNPDLQYLLIPKNATDDIWAEVDAEIASGNYQPVFKSGRYTLIYMETP